MQIKTKIPCELYLFKKCSMHAWNCSARYFVNEWDVDWWNFTIALNMGYIQAKIAPFFSPFDNFPVEFLGIVIAKVDLREWYGSRRKNGKRISGPNSQLKTLITLLLNSWQVVRMIEKRLVWEPWNHSFSRLFSFWNVFFVHHFHFKHNSAFESVFFSAYFA